MRDIPETIGRLLEWASRGVATSPAAVAALRRAAVDKHICIASGIARGRRCGKGTRRHRGMFTRARR